jgi:branched-chain amino acid transport system ATP-binding protein
MLRLENVTVAYGKHEALHRVSLEVEAGRTTVILGANGAGKTTLLRTISGLLDVHDGEVTKGSVSIDGRRVHDLKPAQIVRHGVKLGMEGRRIFAEFTVEENLRVGAHAQRRQLRQNLERVYSLFPVLGDRRRSTAGYLSGGEQQMLVLGRALMSDPKYLLLDEPSLGLAPLLVRQIRDLIVEINQQGTTVLLVEQNAKMALSIATQGYVLENGKIVMHKPARDLLADEDVREFYLGLGPEGTSARSFRDVKHYKRRKRWLS